MDTFKITDFPKIRLQYRIAFFSAVLFGLLAQGTCLFYKISYHDDAFYFFDSGATYSSGRWMLGLLADFDRFFFGDALISLPIFNGIIAIFYLALASVLIVSFLKIRNEILCAIIPAMLMVFPSITGTFGYIFTVGYYMLAVLMAVGGVYLTERTEKWYYLIPGTLLLAASIGIYQAYLPVILCLMLMSLLQIAGDPESSPKQILLRIFRTGAVAAAMMLIYFLVSKIFLAAQNTELTQYAGISEMGSTGIRTYIRRAVHLLYELSLHSKGPLVTAFPGSLLFFYYAAMGVCGVYAVLYTFSVFKINRFGGLVSGMLLLAFIFAANFIMIMADPVDVHILMQLGQVMPLVLLAWLVENTRISFAGLQKLAQKTAVLLMLVIILLYWRFDNKCQVNAQVSQQQAINYYSSMLTQIRSTPGYKDELPVVAVYPCYISDETLLPLYREHTAQNCGITPFRNVNGIVNDYSWQAFLEIWFGFAPEYLDAEEFAGLPEVEAMPAYPDYGSIRIINGAVVIKMADEPVPEE